MKTTNQDFNFFVPIEFEKAQNKKGEKVMKIKGIASTADTDSDGEILEPVGFDLSRFLSTGFLNWNHQAKNDASKIVGEPTLAKITPKGELYVEGTLYNGHPLAESIWSMAETLERNGSSRRIGFSIEGRATERDIANPKRITKALLTGLAITPTPVNTNTYLNLCKGEQQQDWIEYEEETLLEKSETAKYIFEFDSDGKKFGITKSFTVEEIEKEMNTSNMAALAPESLDKKVHALEPNIKKAILGGIIPLKWVDRIEKGGSKAVLGEIRKFGGRDMIKTAEGWKYHGKGTGVKAQEHKAGTVSFTEKKDNRSASKPEPVSPEKSNKDSEVKVSPLSYGELRKLDNLLEEKSALGEHKTYNRRKFDEMGGSDRLKKVNEAIDKLTDVHDLSLFINKKDYQVYLTPGPMRISDEHKYENYAFNLPKGADGKRRYKIPTDEEMGKLKDSRKKILEGFKTGKTVYWVPGGYHFGVSFRKKENGNTTVQFFGRPSSAVGRSALIKEFEVKGSGFNVQRAELAKLNEENVRKILMSLQGKEVTFK